MHPCRTPSLALLLLAAGISNAQTWTQQAPHPTDRDLYGAAFTSPLHGFVITHNHGLFETFDGGDTWSRRGLTGYGSDPYYDIRFIDGLHGWISGSNDDHLYTADGGVTWQPLGSLPGSWWHIDFLTPSVGFFGSNGALAKTTDGGSSWETRSGYPDCPVIYGMDFRDESIGLAAGNNLDDHTFGVFRTSDGGRTWTRTLDFICNDVVFVDTETAIAAAVGDNRFYRSDDAGLTWSALPQSFDADGPLGDLEFAGGTKLAGCSAEGDVWISNDLGQTWTKTLDALGDLPYSWELSFFDADHGWLTGNHGILYRTADGGQSWQFVTNGVGMDIHDIDIHTEMFGMAVAQNGYLLRTTDGGQRWSVQKLEETGQVFGRDEDLNAVDIVDENFAVAAGPGGTVFRTSDGGLSWESVGYPALPGGFWIEDVSFADRQTGFLVGLDYDRPYNKGIYRTDDGGLTWTRPFDDDALGNVQAVDAQHIRLMHLGGRFHASNDGGQTWSDVFLPPDHVGDDPIIEDMEFLDASTGWVCGWWDYVARTTDGGATWQTFTFGNNHDIRLASGLAVMSRDEVWVTASDEQGRPFMLHTTDGGHSWSRTILNQFEFAFSELDASPSGGLWAGGFRGRIISTFEPCSADFNGDGAVNTQDVLAFLNAWAAGDSRADFNGDGTVDTQDVLAFLNAWTAGC